ncbi:hypothetical protein ES703_107718 [subsurface metagenome]
MALSAIELAVLRKKISNARVIFGSFVELFRSAVYLNLPLICVRNFMNDVGRGEYDSYVTNNLGMQAVGMLGIASFASFLVVNFAYDRLAALGEKVVFRNVFNAIPAIVLILAYAASMGVFREALIGPRQQDDVATPAFAWDESLFSQYSTLVPGWDASDLLASYLNQFLAGLNDLDREILRYRDDSDPYGNGGAADQTFFRTESFAKYIYDVNTGTSTFERVADIEEINRYGVNTLYSSEPSNPDNAFSIKFNFTYSGSQWDGYIPTSWDTEDGNFVYGPDSSYPMKILESDGTTEVDSSEYSIVLDEESMIGVPRAIKAIITFDTPSTGYKSRYLAYDVPHKEMNAANLYAYSMEPDEWKNIPGLNVTEMEARFLQVPTGTELPTGYTDYWEWVNYSMTLQTNVSERLSPYQWLQDVIVNNSLDVEGTNALYSAAVIANQIGNQFEFDWEMWQSEYTQALLGQYGEGQRLGPEVGEDYVGWMFNRGTAPNGTLIVTDPTKRLGGTAAHFAASLCMMLRNMSIPARTVTGYIGTNEEQASEAVITALYTHSWVEALIPLDTDLDDSPDRAEWVIFDADPRANSFYTLPPNSGNDVKWVYNVSLELLSDMSGTPWGGTS